MKTNLLNNLPIAAFMASFLLIPVNTSAAGLAFTFTGVVAMLLADYGREIAPVSVSAEVIVFEPAATGKQAALKAA